MKKFKLYSKSRLLAVLIVTICALTVVTSGCKKDEKEKEEEQAQIQHKIVGTWLFNDVNIIFYYFDGGTFDAKKEGLDLSEDMRAFRGIFFVFDKNGTVSIGQGNYGQSDQIGTYTVTDNKITIKEGTDVVDMDYQVSGKTLALIWNREFMEILKGDLDDIFYEFKDIEWHITFSKVD
jgi:hypothetical protein